MRKVVWPVILGVLMSLIIVASGFLYGNFEDYLESNWATMIVWLVIPFILISIIVIAGDPKHNDRKEVMQMHVRPGSSKRSP